MNTPTRPVSVPPTGLAPDECSAAALRHPLPPVILVLVAVPISAASMPVATIDVEGEWSEAS